MPGLQDVADRLSTAFDTRVTVSLGKRKGKIVVEFGSVDDLQRILDHAVAAVQLYGLTDFHAKNAIALERLKADFKGKVEVLPLPVAVLRDLKKLAAEIMREESEKSPMARKAYASFTKFQALVGPWDHVAEGAYHQFVAG